MNPWSDGFSSLPEIGRDWNAHLLPQRRMSAERDGDELRLSPLFWEIIVLRGEKQVVPFGIGLSTILGNGSAY